MSQNIRSIEDIKNFPDNHPKFLKEIVIELDNSIKGKRKITYWDIINYICRKDKNDKEDNEIIKWCCYMIKNDNDYIEILLSSQVDQGL